MRSNQFLRVDCWECEGQGETHSARHQACPVCDGKGYIEKTKEEIEIERLKNN